MLTIAAESAAPRTGHGRRRIHTTRPASDDLKLVLSNSLREHRIKGEKETESVAQCAIAWRWGVAHLGAVHDDARTLGCHRVLVHIARDTASRQGRKSARLGNQRLRFLGSNAPLKRKIPGSRSSPRHSRNSEVKRNGLEPSPFEERDEERTEAAVDVQAEPVPDRQVRKRRDVCSSNRVPKSGASVCVCVSSTQRSLSSFDERRLLRVTSGRTHRRWHRRESWAPTRPTRWYWR